MLALSAGAAAAAAGLALFWRLRDDGARVVVEHVPCSSDYGQMPADCRPSVCGYSVFDSFATPSEIEALRSIASAGMAHGGGAGGPTILDLHSGALSLDTKFISIWHKLNVTGSPSIATESQLDMLERVYERIQSAVSRTFGTACELTSPTFWSRLDASQQPKTKHDEYWHPHVDTAQYGTFAFTALCAQSVMRAALLL